MSGRWAAGGVASAALSSICCVGPLIFSALGVGAGATGLLGGSARFAATLAPYRPLFVILALGCLGAAFYAVYRRGATCGPGGACSPERLQRTRRWLWMIVAVSILLVASPYLLAIE